MKIRYILESLEEFRHAASNVRQAGDSLPVLSSTLEVIGSSGDHRVGITDDPNFEFSMPFKEFVIQASEMAGLKLMARDNIPN